MGEHVGSTGVGCDFWGRPVSENMNKETFTAKEVTWFILVACLGPKVLCPLQFQVIRL